MTIQTKITLGVLIAVAAVTTSLAWWPWSKAESQTSKGTPITTNAAPVQLPQAVQAQLPAGHPLQVQATDRIMGNPNAPITIIEYASLTCSHCRDFHKKTLPLLKKDWIDAGKARYILRDLPWDNLALGMSKVTRCAPPASYYPLVDAFFNAQEAIASGVDTLGEIKKVARFAGLDGPAVEACVKDEALHAQVLGSKEVALKQLGVQGTPTVFVNGIKVDGAVEYDVLKKSLQQAEIAAKASTPAPAAQ